MALDRLFGQIFEIARSLATNEPTRPSAPPPPMRPSAPPPSAAMPEAAPTYPIEAVAEEAEASAHGRELAEAEDAELVATQAAPSVAGEPIVSASMARLLARQGHVHRALAMFDALIAARPGDAALAREAELLRGAQDTPASPSTEDDGLAGENEIVAVRASDRDLLLSWQVGDVRIARGRHLLPNAESIAVRLVLFHRGEGATVRREERERIVERMGEWLVADVPRDSWVTAAVGLRDEERFVSLAHSPASRAN